MEMNPQRVDLCTITDIIFRHGRVKQNADCSHIENEEEEEDDWEKENQMEVQWEVGRRFLERRRREGSSLKAEVTQKVPELVVHERMISRQEK